jgi:hypothetical protein
MNKKILLTICSTTALLASMGASYAAEDLSPIPAVSDAWRFEITPYVWGSGIKGTLGLDNGLAKSTQLSTSQVLGDLKSGGMIAAEAHNGKWGVMGDLVSATLQKSGAASVTTAYGPANNKDAYVDALLGVRAIYATATVNLSVTGTPDKASVSKTTSTVDPIIGAKGRYRIADSTWYVPFYGDIGSGGGTTNLTWQAMAGVGKTFNSLIDASLTYRALYYDMKDGGVMQKTTMLGPQIAVTFKF